MKKTIPLSFFLIILLSISVSALIDCSYYMDLNAGNSLRVFDGNCSGYTSGSNSGISCFTSDILDKCDYTNNDGIIDFEYSGPENYTCIGCKYGGTECDQVIDDSTSQSVCTGGYCDCKNYLSGFSDCGDGIISGNEECDDSNRISHDGCSPGCKDEFKIIKPSYWQDAYSFYDDDGQPINIYTDETRVYVKKQDTIISDFLIDGNVDLTGVNIAYEGYRTFISGLDSIDNMTSKNRLYTENTGDNVYFCPDVDDIDQIGPNCEGASTVYLDCPGSVTIGPVWGSDKYVCEVVDDYYMMYAFTGTYASASRLINGAGSIARHNLTIPSGSPVQLEDANSTPLSEGFNTDVISPVIVRDQQGTVIARYTLDSPFDLESDDYDFAQDVDFAGILADVIVDDSNYNEMELKEMVYPGNTTYLSICNEKGHLATDTFCNDQERVFNFDLSEIDAGTSKTQGGLTVIAEKKTIAGEEYVVVSGDLDALGAASTESGNLYDEPVGSPEGAVPEFSTVGIILAMIIIALGLTIIRKKK